MSDRNNNTNNNNNTTNNGGHARRDGSVAREWRRRFFGQQHNQAFTGAPSTVAVGEAVEQAVEQAVELAVELAVVPAMVALVEPTTAALPSVILTIQCPRWSAPFLLQVAMTPPG